nr:lipopolysaccharide biosynthesis protein [Polymorphobacter sp.]
MADRQTPSRHLKAIWAWRHESALRSRLGNIGHVLTGNMAGTILGLLAVAIAARSLGPHDYGVLALTITFARAIERLVSFQSWQPMIRYGAGLDPVDDRDTLRTLFKFGLVLDITAGIAAWLVAIAAAWAATWWFGWTERTFQLTVVYCSLLLFNLQGMPTAVLRLAGRYRAAAYGQVASAIVRLGLCIGAALTTGNLWTFAIIWMATQILGSLIFLAVGFVQLRRQGITNILSASLAGVTTRFPGLWNFTWSSNLSLTLRSSANQLDTLLVGALAGPAEAGLYHIAKQLGKMASQIGTQVQAVLYPDIARLWAAGAVQAFRRAVVQVEVMLAAFGLISLAIAVVAAEPLLRLFAGPAFAAAAPLLIVQMFAVVLMISGTATHSALLAMGKAHQALAVVTAGTIAFHITLLLLVPRIGAMGANVAHVVLGIIWVTGLAIMLRRALRNTDDGAPSVVPADLEIVPPGGA